MKEVYRDIIKAMCDCSMNVSETSKSIYMSRMGVIHQIDNIIKDYNLDPRNFRDLIVLEKIADGVIEDPCKALYCIECGKELTGLKYKFCSSYCTHKYHRKKKKITSKG